MRRILEFAGWFQSHARRLRVMSSDDVANEIIEKLRGIDDRLGVEVERSVGHGKREIIITAFAESDAFPIVRRIVESIGQSGEWNICALKPPRGFGFSITLKGKKLRADSIRFRSLPKIKNSFELLVPGTTVAGSGAEDAAWLIAETGVGEELASMISHLEFGNPSDLGRSAPIAELANVLRKNESTNHP